MLFSSKITEAIIFTAGESTLDSLEQTSRSVSTEWIVSLHLVQRDEPNAYPGKYSRKLARCASNSIKFGHDMMSLVHF